MTADGYKILDCNPTARMEYYTKSERVHRVYELKRIPLDTQRCPYHRDNDVNKENELNYKVGAEG
ncbi:hypothetical protein DSUL_100193 [Desulfovibrionales bacterium]